MAAGDQWVNDRLHRSQSRPDSRRGTDSWRVGEKTDPAKPLAQRRRALSISCLFCDKNLRDLSVLVESLEKVAPGKLALAGEFRSGVHVISTIAFVVQEIVHVA